MIAAVVSGPRRQPLDPQREQVGTFENGTNGAVDAHGRSRKLWASCLPCTAFRELPRSPVLQRAGSNLRWPQRSYLCVYRCSFEIFRMTVFWSFKLQLHEAIGTAPCGRQLLRIGIPQTDNSPLLETAINHGHGPESSHLGSRGRIRISTVTIFFVSSSNRFLDAAMPTMRK